MKKWILIAALLGNVGIVLAQSSQGPSAVTKADASVLTKEQTEQEEAFQQIVKPLKRIEGPFPMYARHKDVLTEVPDCKLGKLFFVQAAFETGANANGLQAGDPIGDIALDVFRWQKTDDQMELVRPNIRFRWDADDPLQLASARSFPEADLGSFRIEAYSPVSHISLVNVTSLFYGDLFRLNEYIDVLLGGQYMLDRDHSSLDSITGCPENTAVQASLQYFSPHGADGNAMLEMLGLVSDNQLEDSRSLPIKLNYNLWYRKDSDYTPRVADPRIGYFTQDFFSMGRFLDADRTQRYILRFDLRKAHPSQALSEPVKPIVWTLDPSIPPMYRDAVRAGVLRWNKAFEAAGFIDAIQVQDPPKDYDHADARFNVIRWTVSQGPAFAISYPRADPLTGEILNASITFDANYLAYIMDEHQNIAMPAASVAQSPAKWLLRRPNSKMTDDALIWEPLRALAEDRRQAIAKQFGWSPLECSEAAGLGESAAFGWHAMQSLQGLHISKEEYARQFISNVICHEVGHCLGLRHNFEGSTEFTTQQLADDTLTSQTGTAASVMDYIPVNIQAVLKGKGNFFNPAVGDYDVWAIDYGYKPISGAGSAEAERPQLERIASESGEPGHAYMSDENVNTWDPYAVMFDCAKDPVEFSARMLEAAVRERKYAIEMLPKPGESYETRTRLVLQSILETFSEGRMSARFVGGLRASKSFSGDLGAGPTLTPVDSDVQRQALRQIVRHCFLPDSLGLSKQVMVNLSADSMDRGSASWTAPMRGIVSQLQDAMFATLMSADTTDRIVENSFKLQGQKGIYSIQEHFSILLGATFREVGQNCNISPTRRDLQRFSLVALETQASAPTGAISEDVQMLANDSLRRLRARFDRQLRSTAKLDEMTVVHLRDCDDEIGRFLDRQSFSR